MFFWLAIAVVAQEVPDDVFIRDGEIQVVKENNITSRGFVGDRHGCIW